MSLTWPSYRSLVSRTLAQNFGMLSHTELMRAGYLVCTDLPTHLAHGWKEVDERLPT